MKPKRPNRFHKHEVRQMEKLLKESKDDLLDESFHQKLTEEFNRLPNREGDKAIQMIQVQKWFSKMKRPITDSSEALISATDTHLSDNPAPENSSDIPESTGKKSIEQEELEFEARSSTDHGWYDVSAFLDHRIISSGELEVKVRFRGFDSEEDEWVNVKKDIRERSIPLESSECLKVDVGHLVLCFRERSDQAKHFDAHVIEVQRRLHDIRGCRCLFLIQYDHDQTKERVNLRRLCRRPTY